MRPPAAIVVALILALAFAVSANDAPGCHTDTECAQLCPINDVNCDGGPHDLPR